MHVWIVFCHVNTWFCNFWLHFLIVLNVFVELVQGIPRSFRWRLSAWCSTLFVGYRFTSYEISFYLMLWDAYFSCLSVWDFVQIYRCSVPFDAHFDCNLFSHRTCFDVFWCLCCLPYFWHCCCLMIACAILWVSYYLLFLFYGLLSVWFFFLSLLLFLHFFFFFLWCH